jgi:hypothetical protein
MSKLNSRAKSRARSTSRSRVRSTSRSRSRSRSRARSTSRSRSRSRSRARSTRSRSRSRSRASRSNSRASSKCRRGEIYRVPYTRKRGSKTIKVKGNCIKATSQTGMKRSVQDKLYFQKKARSQERAKRKTKSKSKTCPDGQIERVAFERAGYTRKPYTRADGTRVRAAMVRPSVTGSVCIEKRGQPGEKGKQLFHLEPGLLEKYGYTNVKQKTKTQRHRSLNRALAGGIKPLPLFRRINALFLLNKNQDPDLAEKFKQDRDYIKTTDAYKNRDTA